MKCGKEEGEEESGLFQNGIVRVSSTCTATSLKVFEFCDILLNRVTIAMSLDQPQLQSGDLVLQGPSFCGGRPWSLGESGQQERASSVPKVSHMGQPKPIGATRFVAACPILPSRKCLSKTHPRPLHLPHDSSIFAAFPQNFPTHFGQSDSTGVILAPSH